MNTRMPSHSMTARLTHNLSTPSFWAIILVFCASFFQYRQEILSPETFPSLGSWILPGLVVLLTVLSVLAAHKQGKTVPLRAGIALTAALVYLSLTLFSSALPSLLIAVLIRAALFVLLAALVFDLLWRPGKTGIYREDGLSRLTLAAAAVIFLAQIPGVLVSAAGPNPTCRQWPFCPGMFPPAAAQDWLYLVHIGAIGLSGLLLAWLLLKAWKNYASHLSLLSAATLTAALFAGQVLAGALRVSQPAPAGLMLLHAQTSLAVWISLAALLVFALDPEKRASADLRARTIPRRAWKDFLSLTKPFIVLLLLFTTFAGMLLAQQKMPSPGLVAITLLAGALAAGGSGAINQYIDRDLDAQMARTAARPIAAGRIFPAEGLAFGIGLLVAAFYLMARFVNLNAAFLTLAGMIYYLLVYSLGLKRRTAWNIVIGGGAGALPPLVGWSATAGRLDLFAIGLFVIVFLWTPVHFWSLALVRQQEYETVKVPMLPVVKGRRQTALLILLSALLLVGFTWLVSLLAPVHLVYQVAAVLIGVLLLYFVFRLWRSLENRHARVLYRFSNLYLGLLFLALMLDVFIR